MNNAKLWLVVPPAVGLPIFLGAVAVGSFAVHVAVLSKVSWYDDYLTGQPLGTGDAEEARAVTSQKMESAKASFAVPLSDGRQEISVIMPDGTTAKAVLKPNEVLASAVISKTD